MWPLVGGTSQGLCRSGRQRLQQPLALAWSLQVCGLERVWLCEYAEACLAYCCDSARTQSLVNAAPAEPNSTSGLIPVKPHFCHSHTLFVVCQTARRLMAAQRTGPVASARAPASAAAARCCLHPGHIKPAGPCCCCACSLSQRSRSHHTPAPSALHATAGCAESSWRSSCSWLAEAGRFRAVCLALRLAEAVVMNV